METPPRSPIKTTPSTRRTSSPTSSPTSPTSSPRDNDDRDRTPTSVTPQPRVSATPLTDPFSSPKPYGNPLFSDDEEQDNEQQTNASSMSPETEGGIPRSMMFEFQIGQDDDIRPDDFDFAPDAIGQAIGQDNIPSEQQPSPQNSTQQSSSTSSSTLHIISTSNEGTQASTLFTYEEFLKQMKESNEVILSTNPKQPLPIYDNAAVFVENEEEYTRMFVEELLKTYATANSDDNNKLSKFNYNAGTHRPSLTGLVDMLSQERTQLKTITEENSKREIFFNWKSRFSGIMSNIQENSAQYCAEAAKLTLLYEHIACFFSKESAALFNNSVVQTYPKKVFVIGERVLRIFALAPELTDYLPPNAYSNDEIYLTIFERLSGTKQKKPSEGGFVYTFQPMEFSKKRRSR